MIFLPLLDLTEVLNQKKDCFGSEYGSDFWYQKNKTLIVKDLEGFLVVPPGLEPGTK